MKKRVRKRMMKRAGKAAGWIREIAGSKVTRRKVQGHRNRQLGTFGAASPVRHIDPESAA